MHGIVVSARYYVVTKTELFACFFSLETSAVELKL